MRVAFIAAPVPKAPLSNYQRDYYFYLFASRVLTVFNHLNEKDFSRFWMLEPLHLGLLQLIAFLEKQGIDCSFFAPISPPGKEQDREEILLNKILNKTEQFDLIGFSCITASYPAAQRMAKRIRAEYPRLPLVIGGPHAWALDKEILLKSDFDIVVRKEGEITTREMFNALAEKRSLQGIAGLSYLAAGHFVRNIDRPRMDRGILSIPAYEHLEDNFDESELCPEKQIQIPIARLTPTTGCTNNCIWCADFWKHEVSVQNMERFEEEILYLTKKRDTRYFYLGTHNFFHDIDLALKITDTIGSLGNKIPWEAQTRVNPKVDAKVLKHLARMNCKCLHVGIESGNQELLDAMGKNIRLDQARCMLETAREKGLHTHTYWIIGSPYETRESALKTINTMKKWLEQDISSCSEINLLVGYPGTYFYKNPGKYNITWQDPDFSHYDGRSIPTFDTTSLTRRDVEYLFQRALDEYCQVMEAKIGVKEHIITELGKRMPNFDPAVMEAAF